MVNASQRDAACPAAKAFAELEGSDDLTHEELLEGELTAMYIVYRMMSVTEVLLILMAGVPSTAHTLSWLVYALCKHPEVQREAQSQVSS